VRVLVTGGAGFIGHHLVRRLLDEGVEVSVLDDFSTGSRARLEPFLDEIALVEGSIVDPAALDEAIRSSEVIFHEAAIPSVARSVADPHTTNTVNVTGTIEVMLAAARHGVRRVVFASSSSVYGIPAELPCREGQPTRPESPYGASKAAAESYITALGRLHGVETAILRRFNVFGPAQDPMSQYAAVVPRFVTAILNGERPTIYGRGDISRDFTYVDNVVEAALLAARPSTLPTITCNVACGTRYSLMELLDAICTAVGRRIEPIIAPARPGDILHSEADISLARHALGYRVAVPFDEGVRRTVAWYRSTGVADDLVRLAAG
jgi:UDP-glucose 4-epimerase